MIHFSGCGKAASRYDLTNSVATDSPLRAGRLAAGRALARKQVIPRAHVTLYVAPDRADRLKPRCYHRTAWLLSRYLHELALERMNVRSGRSDRIRQRRCATALELRPAARCEQPAGAPSHGRPHPGGSSFIFIIYARYAGADKHICYIFNEATPPPAGFEVKKAHSDTGFLASRRNGHRRKRQVWLDCWLG